MSDRRLVRTARMSRLEVTVDGRWRRVASAHAALRGHAGWHAAVPLRPITHHATRSEAEAAICDATGGAVTTPPILACPSDPAGAPSGLRWVCGQFGWRLWRNRYCVGAVDMVRGGWIPVVHRRGHWWSVALVPAPVSAAARALVREVRRG